MKRFIICLSLVSLLFTSCKNTWSRDDKETFYQTCKEGASQFTTDSNKIKAFCDCRIDVLMRKYPNENDFLEHMDSVMKDADLDKCKELLLKK